MAEHVWYDNVMAELHFKLLRKHLNVSLAVRVDLVSQMSVYYLSSLECKWSTIHLSSSFLIVTLVVAN